MNRANLWIKSGCCQVIQDLSRNSNYACFMQKKRVDQSITTVNCRFTDSSNTNEGAFEVKIRIAEI